MPYGRSFLNDSAITGSPTAKGGLYGQSAIVGTAGQTRVVASLPDQPPLAPAGQRAYYDLVIGHPNLVALWRLNEPGLGPTYHDSKVGPTGHLNLTRAGLSQDAPSPVAGPLVDDPVTGVTMPLTNFGWLVIYDDIAELDLTGSFTYEGWIKSNGGLSNTIFAKFTGSAYLSINAGGFLALAKQNTADTCIGTVVVPTGRWVHFAVTWNTTTAHIYLDGVEGSGATTATAFAGTTSPFVIGSAEWNAVFGAPLDGSLSHCAVYNAVLTPKEVSQHYITGKALFGHINTEEPTDLIAVA